MDFIQDNWGNVEGVEISLKTNGENDVRGFAIYVGKNTMTIKEWSWAEGFKPYEHKPVPTDINVLLNFMSLFDVNTVWIGYWLRSFEGREEEFMIMG